MTCWTGRYEETMTKEERKAFEKEKLGQMTGKEKLEYLWMYYKVWLLIPVALIVAIYLGVTMYRGMNEEILLNLVLIDSTANDYEELSEELRESLGAEKDNQTVRVNGNITSGAYQGGGCIFYFDRNRVGRRGRLPGKLFPAI